MRTTTSSKRTTDDAATATTKKGGGGRGDMAVVYLRIHMDTSVRIDAFLRRWRERTGIASLERSDAMRQLLSLALVDDESSVERPVEKKTPATRRRP